MVIPLLELYMHSHIVKNLADSLSNQDVSTKNYV